MICESPRFQETPSSLLKCWFSYSTGETPFACPCRRFSGCRTSRIMRNNVVVKVFSCNHVVRKRHFRSLECRDHVDHLANTSAATSSRNYVAVAIPDNNQLVRWLRPSSNSSRQKQKSLPQFPVKPALPAATPVPRDRKSRLPVGSAPACAGRTPPSPRRRRQSPASDPQPRGGHSARSAGSACLR